MVFLGKHRNSLKRNRVTVSQMVFHFQIGAEQTATGLSQTSIAIEPELAELLVKYI